jgi:hypothetical protein
MLATDEKHALYGAPAARKTTSETQTNKYLDRERNLQTIQLQRKTSQC